MVVDVLRHYEGGRESDDKLIEKTSKDQCKIEEKSVKIEGWRGRKSKKIGVWRCLGGSWRVLGRLGGLWRDFGRLFWRHWGEDGRNMGQAGAKLAASCAQDGPC